MAGRRRKSNVEEKPGQGLPFLREDEYTNVVLLVEGKRLYTNRCILAYASPVFARRFATECKDKERPELKLVDKKFADIVELLAYLHPGINKRLTGKIRKFYICHVIILVVFMLNAICFLGVCFVFFSGIIYLSLGSIL